MIDRVILTREYRSATILESKVIIQWSSYIASSILLEFACY